MRVGLFLPSVSPIATPEFLTAYGTAAEEAGFASIWIGEHVVFFDDYASRYPYAEDGRITLPPGSGMLEMFALARKVAESEVSSVLLQGESGTGKDVVAKAIHFGSR